MKLLLDRFVGHTPNRRVEPAAQADDEGYFVTQFMERPVDLRISSAWQARALGVGAQAIDGQQGLDLLLKAWGGDALLASLPPEELQKILEHVHFVSVPAGRELIVQDEKGDYALVVLDGLVAVDRIQPTGARARLAEAREGDILGEMSLLDAGARFASCLTLSRCTLAVLTHSTMDELAIEEPRLGMALMGAIARRLSLRMRHLSARLGALLTSA